MLFLQRINLKTLHWNKESFFFYKDPLIQENSISHNNLVANNRNQVQTDLWKKQGFGELWGSPHIRIKKVQKRDI